MLNMTKYVKYDKTNITSTKDRLSPPYCAHI